MSDPSPTFGKRGPRAAGPPPPLAPAPSAAHLELAAAAREALSGRAAAETEVDRYDSRPLSGPDEDMRVYIGPRWGAYRALWAKMKDSPRLTLRRSFMAGSFSSIWLLYRKQYREGVAILLAQALMIHTDVVWSSLFDIAVAIYFGQYGMSIVLSRGARTIARVRAAEASPEVARIRVGAAGGVNWVAALSGVALLTGLGLANISGPFGGTDSRIDDMQSILKSLDAR